ncbi:hypothetical protein BH11MYX1_BH11MYX1_05250 [soil metagenome]
MAKEKKMNKFLCVVGFGFGLMTSACMSEETDVSDDSGSDVESALSSSWPYPVPTGCVALASVPSRCQTNVGHYDVTEAGASLDANAAAAGYTKGYSALCRTNYGYTKGNAKVCYTVGVVSDANFQAIGSQWNGRTK